MKKLIYPAVFHPEESGGYSVVFPDLLGCVTEGDTMSEAIDMAQDAIFLVCIDMEDDGKKLPIPSMFPDHSDNEIISYVDVDLDAYRKAMDY